MDDDNIGSDSDSLMTESESSLEGEHNVSLSDSVNEQTSNKVEEQTEYPKFDFTKWSPKAAEGMSYLCLIPFTNSYQPVYKQGSQPGKFKASACHRKSRIKAFRAGEATNRFCEKHLQNAANSNDLKKVIELLDNGVNPSCYDDSKRTPLHFAASQGYELIVKALLDRGADPNMKDTVGNTPLHLAACTGHISVVTFLLRAGTNLKLVDKHGRTPFTIAKSRLNFLTETKSYSSERVKHEALELCDMLKTFLNLSGRATDADELDQLCGQLQRVTTREEVDHVNSMLSDFASLNIENKKKLPHNSDDLT